MTQDEMIKSITVLSEARKQEWGRCEPINPDEDFTDFLLHLPKNPPLSVVEALLQTFDDSLDDGGTQESVCGYLSETDPSTLDLALANQKARLSKLAPQWLEVLIRDWQNGEA